MKAPNRDLLVLAGRTDMNEKEFEHALELLNGLLYNVESLKSFCIASEIIDVNRYKIIKKPYLIQQIVKYKPLLPFVFVNNKN